MSYTVNANGVKVYAYGEEMNEECAYDYRVTASPEIARNTKEQGEFWKHLYAGIRPSKSMTTRTITLMNMTIGMRMIMKMTIYIVIFPIQRIRAAFCPFAEIGRAQ